MKVKLTLLVEESAVQKGKAWARRRGAALSHVVEEHLESLGEAGAGARLLSAWQGAFSQGEPDGDPRAEAIVAKHVRPTNAEGRR